MSKAKFEDKLLEAVAVMADINGHTWLNDVIQAIWLVNEMTTSVFRSQVERTLYRLMDQERLHGCSCGTLCSQVTPYIVSKYRRSDNDSN